MTNIHKQETVLQIDLQKAFDELSDLEKAKFVQDNVGEISEMLLEQQEKPMFDEDGDDTHELVQYLLGERGVSIETMLDLFADDYEYVRDVINDRCIESYYDSQYEDHSF